MTAQRKSAHKEIVCVVFGALLLALGSPVEAQQANKISRIGFLSSITLASAYVDAFQQGLKELGYAEGKNISIEYRNAEGKLDRLPELAAGLVKLKVDVLVVDGQFAASAAKLTTTIPIVVAVTGDAVETGLVKSLAHPGGNVTGLSVFAAEVTGKRLELLKEAFPKISRVAVLGDPTSPSYQLAWQQLKAAAKPLAVQLQPLDVTLANPDFKGVFDAATKGRADAFLTLSPAIVGFYRKEIVTLVAKSRLPAIYYNGRFVEDGGLMSYGPNLADSFKRAAVFVDKILKGAKPADLPVEQPTKFEFVINLKTAKQIGLTIPPTVLAQADRVIK